MGLFRRNSQYGDENPVARYGNITLTYGGWFVAPSEYRFYGDVVCDNTPAGNVIALASMSADITADNSPSGDVIYVQGVQGTVPLDASPSGDAYVQ